MSNAALRPIDSADNPLARQLVRIATQPRQAQAGGRTLAEGLHLAEVLLAHPQQVRAVCVRRGATEAVRALALQLAAAAAVPAHDLAAALYDRASPVAQGAGLMAMLDVPSGDVALAASALAASRPPRADLVLLDGVQDPGNVGTLIRTAAAAGVDTVVLGPGCAQPWSPRVLRAAMGAHWAVAVVEAAPAELARRFAGPILGADGAAGTELYALQLPDGPVAWVFGAEGQGLSAAARAVCTGLVAIPLAPGVESLNVGAAAAVCLFERVRARRAGALSATRCRAASPA